MLLSCRQLHGIYYFAYDFIIYVYIRAKDVFYECNILCELTPSAETIKKLCNKQSLFGTQKYNAQQNIIMKLKKIN